MSQINENSIAINVKEARLRKGYTQQELSDLTGISIRSVQRIENGDVIPREYTLRLLTEQLELKDLCLPNPAPGQPNSMPSAISLPPTGQPKSMPSAITLPPADQPAADATVVPQTAVSIPSPVPRRLNKPRKIILSAGIGLF